MVLSLMFGALGTSPPDATTQDPPKRRLGVQMVSTSRADDRRMSAGNFNVCGKSKLQCVFYFVF
jgi:hypothetical protein